MLELLVTVMIIGILASIALPQYRKTVELGYRQQAQDLLLTIYYGEKAYFVGNNQYKDPGTNWGTIYTENPQTGSPPPTTYTVQVTGGGLNFTAKAKRQGGQCNNKWLRVDETRAWDGDWPSCP